MSVIEELRHRVGDYLELRAIRRHRSRLGRHDASRYSEYLRACQAQFRGGPCESPAIASAVHEYQREGFASFRTDENAALARAIHAELARQERDADVWNELRRYRGDVYQTFPETEALFRGSVGAFLERVFRAHYKLFFGMIYKSEHAADEPSGSSFIPLSAGHGRDFRPHALRRQAFRRCLISRSVIRSETASIWVTIFSS
jgi:hypothetical protein